MDKIDPFRMDKPISYIHDLIFCKLYVRRNIKITSFSFSTLLFR